MNKTTRDYLLFGAVFIGLSVAGATTVWVRENFKVLTAPPAKVVVTPTEEPMPPTGALFCLRYAKDLVVRCICVNREDPKHGAICGGDAKHFVYTAEREGNGAFWQWSAQEW